MKVVLDTNVYISALNFGGVADQVLALARAGHLQLFLSPSILQEVEGVLLGKFGWTRYEIDIGLRQIRGLAQVITTQERLEVITEDEPDNRILECAVAARADAIVSGDRHLRELGEFRGIPILSPAKFLDRLKR